MTISVADWIAFASQLAKINSKAATEVANYMQKQGGVFNVEREQLIEYAYGVVTKYGEASAALAAEMYDAIAEFSGKNAPPAVPEQTPSYDEVAKTINGTIKTENEEIISASIGRLTKRTGADTTLNNAIRDGAEFAWIPVGDTCAFCITLASRGWQRASRNAIKGGHAEHIHANCDCTYAIRFDKNTNVAGYDPQKYREMYDNADPGGSPKDKINAMRREFYAENKATGTDVANGSAAEEINISGGKMIPVFEPANSIEEAEEFARQFTQGGNYSDVDYSGIDLQYANEFNRAMNDVLSQYDPKYPLRNIEPMNMRSKDFRGSTSEAAYKWGSNDLYFNKGYFKSEKAYQLHLKQMDELLGQVMPNVDTLIETYRGQSGALAEQQLRYVEALKVTGRTNVEISPYSSMVHELGHYLDDTLFRNSFKDFSFDIKESFQTYSGGISAYATQNNREYLAESFTAYMRGETDILDPKLVDVFEGLMNG